MNLDKETNMTRREDHINRANDIINDALDELKALGVTLRHTVPLNAHDPVALTKDNFSLTFKDGPVNAATKDQVIEDDVRTAVKDPVIPLVNAHIPKGQIFFNATLTPEEQDAVGALDFEHFTGYGNNTPEEVNLVTPDVVADIEAGKPSTLTPPPSDDQLQRIRESEGNDEEPVRLVPPSFTPASPPNFKGVGVTHPKPKPISPDADLDWDSDLTEEEKDTFAKVWYHYNHAAGRTESLPNPTTYRRLEGCARVIHGMFGLITELGEYVDNYKRHIFYGTDLDTTNEKEELGDLYWYLALLHSDTGTDPLSAMKANIKKLSTRYPEKFSKQKAISRDTNAERNALESTSE